MVGTFPIGHVLDDTVGQRQTVRRWFLQTLGAAVAQLLEGGAELLRHGVVNDRIDGAVQVDAQTAEEEEPGVQVGLVQEGVDYH